MTWLDTIYLVSSAKPNADQPMRGRISAKLIVNALNETLDVNTFAIESGMLAVTLHCNVSYDKPGADKPDGPQLGFLWDNAQVEEGGARGPARVVGHGGWLGVPG